MTAKNPASFLDYLQELVEKRDEVASDLLRIESRMFKLEESDLLKHYETGNAVLGFSRPRLTRAVREKIHPPPKFMVFSNSSKTAKSAFELAERAEKLRHCKKEQDCQLPSAEASTSVESASDTDPETVGIAGLEAAASRDAELRAAHKKQYEATHHMKTRSQT
ncbi:hypothetical protein Y032_0005g2692 [Ancylostoma ceylanicum]|uniref:Chromatin modification-related protein MEAF6 n=1 Tax=Ancylostoma ceylanicum TaxID=53326 RepID=A0A016VT90_9BILA|nr:hypothetical protein Y032_0005g2692 [Ancylostoma ceylanicum]